MNDENKMPVPDEAQAFPAHAEDDIATLEREARAKREAELLNAQDDEEKDPVQPAVNKLKSANGAKQPPFLPLSRSRLSSWHGVVTGFIAISCGSLRKKETGHSPADEQTDYRQRNDLGMSTDTAEEEPEQQDNGQSSTGEQGRWLRPPRQNSTKPASLFAVMVRPPHRTR